MEKIINDLKNGEDKSIRNIFFEVIEDIRIESEKGEIAWADVVERININIKKYNDIVIKYWDNNFINDKEKMIDFKKLSKKEFLESYSYITEAEYDKTTKMVGLSIIDKLKK